MTGNNNTDCRDEKSRINQRNRRRMRTVSEMTMEQLIRETRREIYKTQQREEAVLNKNSKIKLRRPTLQQQVSSREMQRYLTIAAVQVSESSLTAYLADFCNKIPSGNYRVKILIRKNNKVSVRMTYRATEQPQLQRPDSIGTQAGP